MIIQDPFSLKHLPYGIVDFQEEQPHLCVRYRDLAVSLEGLRRHKLLTVGEEITRSRNLNPFLRLSPSHRSDLRARVKELLAADEHLEAPGATMKLQPYPLDDSRVLCPVEARDFVDFYCSRHHAFRVGCLFRGPENALPEQYFHLPIGYHGRSSTLFGSGRPIPRPQGIRKGEPPSFGDSQRLDYELEVGFVLHGHHGRLSPEEAWQKIFGVMLVNDWSARDIQAFEYKPLGPFLGKSFATTVGSWITPLEALKAWRCKNTDSAHQVLPHLAESEPHHLDLPLQADLTTAAGDTVTVCRSNLKNLAWSAAQMVAHLSSNGTIITAGDVIATGTVSGPEKGAEGCLLERTEGGKAPFSVGQEQRTFLLDGDTITLYGGHPGVGLGPCRGKVLASE